LVPTVREVSEFTCAHKEGEAYKLGDCLKTGLLGLACVVEVTSRVLGVTPVSAYLQPHANHPKIALTEHSGSVGAFSFQM